MANKPYLTMKRVNEVLSLYGVKLIERRYVNFVHGGYVLGVKEDYYLAPVSSDGLDRWEIPTYILPPLKTNQQRLEVALANLDKVI